MTLEQHLITAAKQAGDHIRKHAFEVGFEWKHYNDPVTILDKEAEQIIRAYLSREAPGNFIGEEYGFEDNKERRTYIIDPIDGTKSFTLRDFISSVSIGLEEDGKLTGGVVYDFMRDIMYVGFHGESYILNAGKRYEFRAEHGMPRRRLSIDGDIERRGEFDKERYSIDEKKGSIALSMAELAAGNMDGIVTGSVGKGNIWDVAAGYYLLHANGFLVLDYEGIPFDYKNADRGIVALKPQIAPEVLSVLDIR